MKNNGNSAASSVAMVKCEERALLYKRIADPMIKTL